MPFEAVWSEKARKSLAALDRGDASRIIRKVEEIKANPLHFLERMVDADCHKLRVGDYRVFIALNEGAGKLYVIGVKHRKNAYK